MLLGCCCGAMLGGPLLAWPSPPMGPWGWCKVFRGVGAKCTHIHHAMTLTPDQEHAMFIANMWGGAWVGGVVQGVQPCGGPPHATHHVLGHQRACIGHFTWPWGAIAPPQPPMHLLNFKLWWVQAPPQVQAPTVGPRAPWPLHIVWGWPLPPHGSPRPHCGAKKPFAPIPHFKILPKMCMP